jgi:hypothetical protein
MTSFKSREELLEEKRRFWKQHIEGWQASDLSQIEYCRQHHLIAHRFTYWKQKFTSSPAQSFIELKLPPVLYPQTSSSASTLRVAVNRFQVAVDRDFDPITLRQLVYTLEQL